ncbi:MAG: hypothetical protein HC888_06415 [Candidatus Competibacteraceae bacterium]|nr:hypothetical protein [Candidatus Competibacteraceae bacterium]
MKLHRVYTLFCVVLAGWWIGDMSSHGLTWYRVAMLCGTLIALGIHAALAMVDRGDE